MSYIIVCRTPNGKLVAITEGDPDDESLLAEFPTEEDARRGADNTMACQVFPYEIVEVNT